jgi:hypothetical protein
MIRESDERSRFDASSFSAGRDSGMRVAAGVARLAALQLVQQSRWWNRRRCRLMARALVAQAEEMEAGVGRGAQAANHARIGSLGKQVSRT